MVLISAPKGGFLPGEGAGKEVGEANVSTHSNSHV